MHCAMSDLYRRIINIFLAVAAPVGGGSPIHLVSRTFLALGILHAFMNKA
jgi:hypothetical protein